MTNNNTQNISNDLFQVYAILNFIPEFQKNRIPSDVYDYIVNNMQIDYTFRLDSEKEILEQDISPSAMAIFTALYAKYISDYPDKWKKYYQMCKNKGEREMREKNTCNSIFLVKAEKNELTKSITDVTEYKENIFEKFINKLKRLFKRK